MYIDTLFYYNFNFIYNFNLIGFKLMIDNRHSTITILFEIT